jgi:hypothetical protein
MGFRKFSRVMMNSFVRLSKIQWFRKWSFFWNVLFWGMCPIFGPIWYERKFGYQLGDPQFGHFMHWTPIIHLSLYNPRGGLLVFPCISCTNRTVLQGSSMVEQYQTISYFRGALISSQLGWSNKTSPKQQTTSQICASTSIMAHL